MNSPKYNIALFLLVMLATLSLLPAEVVDHQHHEGKSAVSSRQKWRELVQGEDLARGRKVAISPEANYHLTQDENDSKQLTDGRLSQRKDDRIWFDRDAVGWANADSGAILIIDLEAVKPVEKAAIRILGGKEQSGLVFPNEIEVIGSTDGKTFHTLAKRSQVTFNEKKLAEENPDEFFYLPEEGKAYVEPFVFPVARELRYIGFVMKSPTSFLFTDELAVIQAAEGQHVETLAGLPESKVTTSGIAIRPRQSELAISSNIVTPTWFLVSDMREKKTAPVTFYFDLPEGISITMGPTGKATRKPTPDHPNRWVIEDLYKVISHKSSGAHGAFGNHLVGPVYFQVAEGTRLAEDATASLRTDDPASSHNVSTIPVRLMEIPEVPPLKHLDISFAWMEEFYAQTWPDFFRNFAALGFDTVSTFPRNNTSKASRAQLLDFVKAARQHGFRILYNESPFHVMWNTHKDKDELHNVVGGVAGKHACPVYTGTYYQEEIRRVADIAKEIRPDYVFFDIEFWDSGAREAKQCDVCQKAFKESGESDWKKFLIAQGTRMQRDLQKAIAGTAPDGGNPVSGDYSADVGYSPYHQVHDVYSLYPKYVDVIQPSIYNRGNVRGTHNVIRENFEFAKNRCMIPWMTAGTYGVFPPQLLEQNILEALLNGARGITYFAFWDFDPLHFYYHARALAWLAPHEKLLAEGSAIKVEGTNPELLYSAWGTEHEGLLLVTNDGKSSVTIDVRIPGRKIAKVQDVMSGKTLGDGEDVLKNLTVESGKQRLLHFVQKD